MTTMAVRDPFENLLALLSLAAVIATGGMLATLARDLGPASYTHRAAQKEPVIVLGPEAAHELRIRFDQGVALLHAKRFDFAETALTRVVELAPNAPEGWVNLGFAILGQQRFEEAGEAFNRAINLKPEQANAYWGMALALEGLKDYEGALGAMRSYIHLSTVPNDPYLPKARAALWEWEAQLGRIPGYDPAGANAPAQSAGPSPRRNEGHPLTPPSK